MDSEEEGEDHDDILQPPHLCLQSSEDTGLLLNNFLMEEFGRSCIKVSHKT